MRISLLRLCSPYSSTYSPIGTYASSLTAFEQRGTFLATDCLDALGCRVGRNGNRTPESGVTFGHIVALSVPGCSQMNAR
jgi:hypothetical protein